MESRRSRDKIFYDLLENPKTRPTILFLWDQLFDAEAEIFRIEEFYRDQLAQAEKRVQELEARFIQDSHNSSKPPSSDGLKKTKRTRSLRAKSKNRVGGQVGHKGSTYSRKLIPTSSVSYACITALVVVDPL